MKTMSHTVASTSVENYMLILFFFSVFIF